MLLKIGSRNYHCFKEGFELSLELGAQCPSSVSKGKVVSSLLCVKGANASGKTNALKAISFLRFFCCDSFSLKPDGEIPVTSYFRNNDPIDFFCEFEIHGTYYKYELSLTEKEVIFEKLSKKSKRLSPAFERNYNNITYATKEFNSIKDIKQRSNASIVSTTYQYENSAMSDIYAFFSSITSNIGPQGKFDLNSDYRSTASFYRENTDILNEAINIIKSFDFGITDIKIKESTLENGDKYHFPVFEHDAKVDSNWLVFHDESLGTQTLYKTLPYFITSIKSGGILVLDEFDTDYHPHILKMLIGKFDDDEVNAKGAQLIFTTHNTDILDYMTKYRTVFVNKESSESYTYRLDEIPGDILRNDRSMIPVYNSGKIGGVPRL